MPTLKLHSPAKVNLFLRIVGRRSNGYHDLASLFQTIDLMDILTFDFEESAETSLTMTCSDPNIPTDQSNLVMKAANLFGSKTGLKFSLNAHLDKKIPYQAGLGGGSSNAATTLWALNELFGRPVTLQQLSAWSVEIGADVPFFLSEGTAYCTGIGEVVHPLLSLAPQTLHLVKPPEGLSTPSVYKNLKLDQLKQRDPEESLRMFLAGSSDFFNDMEDSAFSLLPSLAELKKTLQLSGFEHVLMSGSGTCFFCLGNGKTPALGNHWSHKARYINRYPGCWFLSAPTIEA